MKILFGLVVVVLLAVVAISVSASNAREREREHDRARHAAAYLDCRAHAEYPEACGSPVE
jgi:Flp pilus assembly protein TadG